MSYYYGGGGYGNTKAFAGGNLNWNLGLERLTSGTGAIGTESTATAISIGNGTITTTITGNVTVSQGVSTSGSPTMLTLTGAAHTTLGASAESVDVLFDIARTVQFATGDLTTQRAIQIEAPTYAFAGGSTLTNSATIAIDSAPNAGTNTTFTTLSGVRIGSEGVTVGPTSSGLTYATIRIPSHTATVSGTTQVTSSPAISALSLGQISINDSANENVTIDNGATLYISNAPAATGGSTVTLTNAYSLWVDAGASRFDGAIRAANGTVSAPSITFDSDPDTGIFTSASIIAITVNGTDTVEISDTGVQLISTGADFRSQPGSTASPAYTERTDTNTGLYFPDADILGIVSGGAEIVRWTLASTGGGWMIMDEADSDPGTAALDSLDSGAIYFKANKFVIAYNYSGTIAYITIPLDTATTAWTHNTTAP